MQQETNENQSELHAALTHAHRQLRACAFALREALHSRDPARASGRLHALDDALHAHLLLEEQLLLPAYEMASASDASLIRSEHARLRATLHGLRAELSKDGVDELLTQLLTHTHHEEQQLFRWADHCLTSRVKRCVLHRLTPVYEAS